MEYHPPGSDRPADPITPLPLDNSSELDAEATESDGMRRRFYTDSLLGLFANLRPLPPARPNPGRREITPPRFGA